MWPWSAVTDLVRDAEAIRRHRYGMIEVIDGRFSRIVLRPWPKFASIPETLLLGRWRHRVLQGDCIRLYYNQPRRCSNYLILKYAESARNTRLLTLTRAMAVLDEVARIKQSDALLCEASNRRITTGATHRFGWEPHYPSSWRRHFIKRFYGVYPLRPKWLAELLQDEPPADRLIASETQKESAATTPT